MAASVPLETNRSVSMDSTAATIASARCVSTSVGAP